MKITQQQIVEATQRTWTIGWHPQGEVLASAGSNKTVTLWKYGGSKLQKLSTLQTDHSKTIRSIKFSHKGDKIAVGSFDATISVWVYSNQNNEYEILSTLEGHQNQIKSVSWSTNDKKIASCSRDKNIWIWEFDYTSYDYVCDSVLEGHTQDVKFVSWFPCEEPKLVSASYDNTIRIWEGQDDDYVCKQVLDAHKSIVWCVQITPKSLFSASQDCTVIRWDLNIQTQKYSLKQVFQGFHFLPIYSLIIYRQKFAITGSADNSICLWDVESKKNTENSEQAKTIKPEILCKVQHNSDINCLSLNPKNLSIFASCSDDETIRLWKISDS